MILIISIIIIIMMMIIIILIIIMIIIIMMMIIIILIIIIIIIVIVMIIIGIFSLSLVTIARSGFLTPGLGALILAIKDYKATETLVRWLKRGMEGFGARSP